MLRIPGLTAAVFTPFDQAGELALGVVDKLVDRLVADGVRGLFVCGSTGEGASLTTDERRAVAERYLQAAAGRASVIVHVGHDSLHVARELAAHAQAIGATAIAAVPPSYFRPATVQRLADCMDEIARAAPELPFYYYHIPPITGVDLPMTQLLQVAAPRIPNLVGIKYSTPKIAEFQQCVEHDGGRFDILFGCDEMLLASLAAGGRGAVGSTYNYAAPLYNRVIAAFDSNQLERARELQSCAARMVDVQIECGGMPAFKATMAMLGEECGPCRLPLGELDEHQKEQLRARLDEIGFFDWARTPPRADDA